MALREFKLPDPGEGLTEADIVTWHVAVGDTVKVNDVVVEIETAKSLVELPVPFAGTVSALHVAEGDTVEVGTPIITVDDGVGGASAPAAPAPAAAQEPAAPAAPASDGEEIGEGLIGGTTSTGRTAVLVGYGVKQTEAVRRPRKGAATPAPPRRRPPLPCSNRRMCRLLYGRTLQACRNRRMCRRLHGRRRRRAPARWPSRRCASWPRTSASTSAP